MGYLTSFWYLKLLRPAVFMEKRSIELEPPHGLTVAARGAGVRNG